MSLHITFFTSDIDIHRRGARLSDFSLRDLQRTEPAWDLSEAGVIGAFALSADAQDTGFLNGELRAILHGRDGAPEWVKVCEDFRYGWCALPDETQAELLDAEREGRQSDDLSEIVLSPKLNSRLPQVVLPTGGSSFSTVTIGPIGEDPKPVLPEDMTAFLWVLNMYQDEKGKPLKVLPNQDRIPRFPR